MQKLSILSRREVVSGIVAIPAITAARFTAAASMDATLIALGIQFNELASAIDCAIEHGGQFDALSALLPRFDAIEAAILATQAKTIRGLQIKAQAAAWALLGNLDLAGKTTTDQRMSLSIIRDLIVLDAGNSGSNERNTDTRRGACPATM